MIAAVIDRLKADIVALGLRVEGAVEFTDLVNRSAMPQVTPCAFVLPLGLNGRNADAVAGLYRQDVRETVAVILILGASGDPTGQSALPELGSFTKSIVESLAGWSPNENVIGVFELVRGALLSISNGYVIYQVDFAIDDQLRITR